MWWGNTKLRDQIEAAKIQFIITELDLAFTFCDIAASANNDDKARRNTASARKAYDSATHFLASATTTPETRQAIDNKVERLKSLLGSLEKAGAEGCKEEK